MKYFAVLVLASVLLFGGAVEAAAPVRMYLPFVAKNYVAPPIVLALDNGTPWGISCWRTGTGQQNALVYSLTESILVDAILIKAPQWADRLWYRGRVHIYQVHSVTPLLLTQLYSGEENILSGEFYPVDQFYPFPISPSLRVEGVIMVAVENTVPLDGGLWPCLEVDGQANIPANTHWTLERRADENGGELTWREHYSLGADSVGNDRTKTGYPKIRIRGYR